MSGRLITANTILQCTRCWTLRNIAEEECTACRERLHEHVTESRTLPLCAVSTDRYFEREPIVYMTAGSEA